MFYPETFLGRKHFPLRPFSGKALCSETFFLDRALYSEAFLGGTDTFLSKKLCLLCTQKILMTIFFYRACTPWYCRSQVEMICPEMILGEQNVLPRIKNCSETATDGFTPLY